MNLTRDEARERASVVSSVDSYAVDLDLTRGERVFGSTTTVRFSATPGASTFIDAITDRVHRIVLNGRDLDPAVAADGVRIQLPGLEAENELRVEADALYTNTGEGLHRFTDPVDGETYLYTQFEVPDSRRMFAVFEQPDLKAAFRFTVTAPAHWEVVSNAPTPEPEPAGAAEDGTARARWAFPPTPRLSSYVTALVAGPYRAVRSELTSADGRTIPLGVFARASIMEHLDAENVFTLTRQGFEFFEAQFGMPYPFEKYDQLFVPEFNAGAMENAGAVTFLESYVFRSRPTEAMVERRATTILHELAHMWFGDLVTMRWWNDLWLNESFAEFMATLASAENTEFTGAWTTFSSMEKSWAYRQDQLPTTHPIVAPIRHLDDVLVNFDGITYAKGASVLRQLVAWVGQEHFMEGVRAYFRRHAWANTELPDLMAELEAASGRDLSAWSRLWLETAGVNKLEPRIGSGADGAITSFEVLQSAPDDLPTLRPHRAAIGLYDFDGAGRLVRVHREELDIDGAATAVPGLVGRPRPALVLVNDDDLAYAKIRLDDQSLRTAQRHLKDIAESLPRTLVWASAWDAVRDGETPARDYVELVLANIAHESDPSVVLVLLRQLNAVLDFYAAPADRQAMAEAAAESLGGLVQAAAPGSDHQLQFAKAFALRARTPGQLDRLAGILDGTATPEGLAVDTDLRWELLTGLVAGGRAGGAEIDKELARDDTANGRLAAEQARAAVPTAAAKEAVWRAVVEEGSLSNTHQRQAIAGFNRVHDPRLLAPFADRYFAAVRGAWTSRSHELAQQIATGLFPSLQVGPETLEASDRFLESLGEDLPALRRLVLEERDGVARALRARAADR